MTSMARALCKLQIRVLRSGTRKKELSLRGMSKMLREGDTYRQGAIYLPVGGNPYVLRHGGSESLVPGMPPRPHICV